MPEVTNSGFRHYTEVVLLRSRISFLLLMAAVFAAIGVASAGAAETAVYSATQTIPVPPASNFSGQAGGDGWGIELSNTQQFNVFHHSASLTVACHEQADASPCWSPRTISEGGSNFAVNGHPVMHLDQSTGRLYVWGSRNSDSTGGVVCIDTTQAASNPNPFCGFTALTPAGDSPPQGFASTSGIGIGMLVGHRWYAFNYVNGSGVSGAKNELLCFDVSTKAPCDGQPFAVAIGAGTVSSSGFPEPATAAIGTRLILPLNTGESRLACFDTSSQTSCGGSFPSTLGFSYAASAGSPFPSLDSSGVITGFCLPIGSIPCYDLSGAAAPTPAGLPGAITPNSPWNGPAVVVGPRVLVANGNSNEVRCFSYVSGASCPGYPKALNNLSLLYSVNPDPQRPTCLWVNADTGSAQIQSFDAFTGEACGTGATRVLASQFVVATKQCEPATYTSLRIVSPGRASYTNGSVQFADGDGNAIPGATERVADGNGVVDLSGLNLSTATGLPQFLVQLAGGSSDPKEVTLELTWTGVRDDACVRPGTRVSAPAAQAATPVITVSASSVDLPPAQRCLSRRRFNIHIVSHRRDPLKRATVLVAGKPVRVVSRRIGGRRRLAATVDLRGVKKSTVSIRIRAVLRSGKVKTGRRTYLTCSSKRKRGTPKL